MKTNSKIQLYPVLRLAVFLVAGIVAGERLFGMVSAVEWFACLAVSFLFALFSGRHCYAQTVFLFLSFTFLGGCLTANKLSGVNVPLPDKAQSYSAVVVSRPVVAGKVVRCDLLLTDRRVPLKVKASIYRDGRADTLMPGDGIEGVSVLEKPENYPGSTFDYRRYLLYHGFAATTFLYLDDWHTASVSLKYLSYLQRTKIAAMKLRNVLLDKLAATDIGGQDYAILAAMALGERVSVSDELADDYSVSGALHVLSLSGLHLAVIYAMLSLLFFRRGGGLLPQVFILLAVWAYVFVVGMPVSAVRSAVMLTVYSVVGLLNRDRISLNTLAIAAVAVLVANPLSFYDVGFQMSFAAVLFIIILYRPVYLAIPERVRGMAVVGWVCRMASVSVAAQAGVAPLVAFYFGRFSCYFLLANFVVVPLSAVILYGVVALVLSGWWPWLESVLSAVLAKAVTLMNACVSAVASLPGASIDGIHICLLQLVMVYVVIFSVYVLSLYAGKMRWQRHG